MRGIIVVKVQGPTKTSCFDAAGNKFRMGDRFIEMKNGPEPEVAVLTADVFRSFLMERRELDLHELYFLSIAHIDRVVTFKK